ncbi:MAG: PIN domain-containing protein [Thermostichus sp. DRC_bins_24]
MKFFLDANILFSGAKSEGAIRQLVHRLCSDHHQCWVDAYVVEEARRNLLIKYPDRLEDLFQLLELMHFLEVLLHDLPAELKPLLPEKDQPVLAAAIHLQCDGLITGDRTHFGSLYGKTIAEVTIYSPRGVAELLYGEKQIN